MSSQFYSKPAQNPQSKPSQQVPANPAPQYAQSPNNLHLNDNNLQESQPMFPVIAATSHPGVAMVHIVLKIAVVAIFVVFPFFSDSFFIKQIVVVLAAIDFWIVKNVAGRLLVGLRWWVDFQENGDQKWKFQCKVNQQNVNKADDKVFWWTLALFCLIWLLLAVANIIGFNITNLIICLFCLAMLAFNLYSYYKCSKAQSENIKKLAFQYGAGMAAKFMTGSIIANYF